jgi:hypothetical protein
MDADAKFRRVGAATPVSDGTREKAKIRKSEQLATKENIRTSYEFKASQVQLGLQ